MGVSGFQGDLASKMQANSKHLTYPKASKGPAMKELQNNLSHLMCVFLHPILETSSIVCCGVKASMADADMGRIPSIADEGSRVSSMMELQMQNVV